jgi:hypothetical protein
MMRATLRRPVACSRGHVSSAVHGLRGNRPWRQILAPVAIAASAVTGGLHGTTDAAYACHVDGGSALLHGHRVVVYTSRSHTRGHFPARVRCVLCEWRHPEVSSPGHPGR